MVEQIDDPAPVPPFAYVVSFWVSWLGHSSIRTPGRVISATVAFDYEITGDDINELCAAAAATVRRNEQAYDERGRQVVGAICSMNFLAATRLARLPAPIAAPAGAPVTES